MSLTRSIASVRALKHFIQSYQSSYLQAYNTHPEYMDDVIQKSMNLMSLTHTLRFGLPHDVIKHHNQYLMDIFFNRVPTATTIIDGSKFTISGMGEMILPKKLSDPVLDAYVQDMRKSMKYRNYTYNVRPFSTYYPPNYSEYLLNYYENSRHKPNMIYNKRKMYGSGSGSSSISGNTKSTYDSICEIIICKYPIEQIYMLKEEGITIDLTPCV
jgi:hypothetical protein